MKLFLEITSIVSAPLILCIFGFVSAYVLKFGLPRTGIYFDYILLTVVIVLICIWGGAL